MVALRSWACCCVRARAVPTHSPLGVLQARFERAAPVSDEHRGRRHLGPTRALPEFPWGARTVALGRKPALGVSSVLLASISRVHLRLSPVGQRALGPCPLFPVSPAGLRGTPVLHRGKNLPWEYRASVSPFLVSPRDQGGVAAGSVPSRVPGKEASPLA